MTDVEEVYYRSTTTTDDTSVGQVSLFVTTDLCSLVAASTKCCFVISAAYEHVSRLALFSSGAAIGVPIHDV